MFHLPPSAFIVLDSRGEAVVAPPGYSLRYSDGTVYRDGTCPRKSGPEHGPRAHAFRFASHRAAARVASKCVGARIERIEAEPSIRVP